MYHDTWPREVTRFLTVYSLLVLHTRVQRMYRIISKENEVICVMSVSGISQIRIWVRTKPMFSSVRTETTPSAGSEKVSHNVPEITLRQHSKNLCSSSIAEQFISITLKHFQNINSEINSLQTKDYSVIVAVCLISRKPWEFVRIDLMTLEC